MSAQLDRLAKRLEAIPKRVKEAVQPSLQKSGDELAGMMKHLAPKDTGALEESITVTPAGQSTPPYSQPGGSMVVPENAVAITAGNSEVRYAHLRGWHRSFSTWLLTACSTAASAVVVALQKAVVVQRAAGKVASAVQAYSAS